MFEDSTFESAGRIRTRSRGWMIATFALNGSILFALILIPLIYPEALSRQNLPFLVEAPVPPSAPQPETARPVRTVHSAPDVQTNPYEAPRLIPGRIVVLTSPEPPSGGDQQGLYAETTPFGTGPVIPSTRTSPVVVLAPPHSVRLSGPVVEGRLIYKPTPRYPPIAIVSRTQGTIILAATISKGGTIENLRVVSGPAMLQQAALDAVKNWRYRPYLLDGQPVEVETTVNVVFTLGG